GRPRATEARPLAGRGVPGIAVMLLGDGRSFLIFFRPAVNFFLTDAFFIGTMRTLHMHQTILEPEMKRELHIEAMTNPRADLLASAFARAWHGLQEDHFVSGRMTMA